MLLCTRQANSACRTLKHVEIESLPEDGTAYELTSFTMKLLKPMNLAAFMTV